MSGLLHTMCQGADPNLEFSREVKDALALNLGHLQRKARGEGIPLVTVFEGWEASGKGTAINALLLALDARGCVVRTIKPPTEDERFHPFLHRFWLSLPEAGRMTIFDRSWYDAIWSWRVDKKPQKGEWRRRLEEIRAFEAMLSESGTVLIKIFLHISKKEQARRFKKLCHDEDTAWRIDQHDQRQHDQYHRWSSVVEETLEQTHRSFAPWIVVAAESRSVLVGQVKRSVEQRWEQSFGKKPRSIPSGEGSTDGAKPNQLVTELEAGSQASISRSEQPPILPSTAPALPTMARVTEGASPLENVDRTCRLDRAEYEAKLGKLQKQLRLLEHRLYRQRVAAVIVFEGWDAAGKGGAIRRLVAGLDPRGYDVIPVAAPTDVEKRHHYLWRFWTHMPKDGHVAIFDRSWYGRVLVERVEGFCRAADWMRAYDEIVSMERSLTDHGTVVMKFWLEIDSQEQLRRFEERTQNPEKTWKITEEDWRNRARRGDYEIAVSDMIVKTSVPEAPWTIVPGNDKLYARHFVLKTVAETLEQRLKSK